MFNIVIENKLHINLKPNFIQFSNKMITFSKCVPNVVAGDFTTYQNGNKIIQI